MAPSTRILVTGAQGFLGRYVVARLARASNASLITGLGRSPAQDGAFHHQLTIADERVSAPVPGALIETIQALRHSDRYEYVRCDLLDRDRLRATLERIRPQVILHLAAALRGEDESTLDRNNVDGTRNLLETCREVSAGSPLRIVLASSGGVYGRRADGELPLVEEYEPRPIDPYSRSKAESERLVLRFPAAPQDRRCIARIFNVVGPGQEERHLAARLAQQISVPGDQATPVRVGALDTTRDFIDVRDAARAIVMLVDLAEPPEIVNVASGIETSGRDVLEQLLDLSGRRALTILEHLPPRIGDIRRHVACVRRLRGLGFFPRYSLQDSLRDLLRYYGDVRRHLGIHE